MSCVEPSPSEQAAYDTPFWRTRGLSGQVIGNGDPVDVTFETYSQGKYWLMGFISGDHRQRLDDAESAICWQGYMDGAITAGYRTADEVQAAIG